MQSGDYIKVGISETPEYRIKMLQTGNPLKILLLLKVEEKNHLDAEKYFHKKFANQKACGEWFKINESIRKCIRDMKQREYEQNGGGQ